MFFLGDISLPGGVEPTVVGFPADLEGPGIATLEGAIATDPLLGLRTLKVHQAPHVVGFLERLGVRAVSLATNHLFDACDRVHPTAQRLRQAGVAPFGAGDTEREAAEPAVISADGKEIALLGFGWEAIGCRPAGPGRPGVNPLRPQHVIESIHRVRAIMPAGRVVAVCHWGYELEPLPHPMHVDLARRAVDAGADAVLGSHPHCVLGAEIYRGAPIVYGLGNWYVAEGRHFGWELRYPPLSRRQLAFEWDLGGSQHRVHWFESEPHGDRVVFKRTGLLADDDELAALSPFRDQSLESYEAHFRRHRRKTKGLPVYRRADVRLENWAKDRWVDVRGRLLTVAIRLGLKGGPR